jgi:predicted glycogen debranching enzyme
MPAIDKKQLAQYETASRLEWIETNGLGGWSSSSITGSHTRRYHGLLVAATRPPTERMVLVSKLDETIVLNGERFELGSNNYGDTIYPRGYQFLTSFRRGFFPEWTFEAGGLKLSKTVAMVHGQNTTLVLYKVAEASSAFTLELLPLLAVRDYHQLTHANDAINQEYSFANDIFQTRSYDGTPEMYIKIPGASFEASPGWYYNFNYSIEQYRGLEFKEDLYSPGKFNVTLHPGDTLGIIISTNNPGEKNAFHLFAEEEKRRMELLPAETKREITQQLILAADQFIVRRDEDLKTIIAGYHWFTDWGRDTMISLPGLCLVTGRFNDAKKILSAFAKSLSMGMLPNRFQDKDAEPAYNNVDGTLWYFIAIDKYLKATGDKEFVINQLLPVLREIIDWHLRGTRYNIHVEENGLLYAGEEGQQLTWMDARIGDWVVTPRMGKPVEIQALWYNALRIYAKLLVLGKQQEEAARIENMAATAKSNFEASYWWDTADCLYDSINEYGMPVAEMRPNQLFAISLPYPLIDGDRAKKILAAVASNLYTPVGLRSVDQQHAQYVPVYGGDMYHRDAAYHQGTVWSWLLGPFIDAIMATSGDKEKAATVVRDFEYHLNEGCIGSVSEIFDAEPPHHPRGCAAQAWGVAELLRVIKEYRLY